MRSADLAHHLLANLLSASIRPLTPVFVKPVLSTSKSISSRFASSETWHVIVPLLPRSNVFLMLAMVSAPRIRVREFSLARRPDCYSARHAKCRAASHLQLIHNFYGYPCGPTARYRVQRAHSRSAAESRNAQHGLEPHKETRSRHPSQRFDRRCVSSPMRSMARPIVVGRLQEPSTAVGLAFAPASSSAGRTRRAGSSTANLLPRPGSLSMTSSAWCRINTCLTMAKPSPVPPVLRERLRSTR